jgi:hypothetical protein
MAALPQPGDQLPVLRRLRVGRGTGHPARPVVGGHAAVLAEGRLRRLLFHADAESVLQLVQCSEAAVVEGLIPQAPERLPRRQVIAGEQACRPRAAFPAQLNPGIARPGWRAEFFDYLYLGFTNATAFSPTDVMPLARWGKLAMTVQAVCSLMILGLVIARAANIFT